MFWKARTSFLTLALSAASLLCFPSAHLSSAPTPEVKRQLAIQVQELDPNGRLPVGSLAFLIDDEHGFDPRGTDAAAGNRFFTVAATLPRFPVSSDAAFWYRLRLANSASNPVPCIIELDHSALNDLRVFHENRRVFAGGEVLPFDERGLPHRRPAVVLSAPPGESTVYIRMTGPSPRRIPLRIYAPADFEMMAALDLTWLWPPMP